MRLIVIFECFVLLFFISIPDSDCGIFEWFAPTQIQNFTNIFTEDKFEEINQLMSLEKLKLFNNMTSTETIEDMNKNFTTILMMFSILFYTEIISKILCVLVIAVYCLRKYTDKNKLIKNYRKYSDIYSLV